MTTFLAFGLVACLLVAFSILGVMAFEKLSEPPEPDSQDDTRQIDIIKRGEVYPWPKDS